MDKLFITLLQIILAVTTVLSKSVYSDEEFIYIGSYKPETNVPKGNSRDYDENDYFVSMQPVEWSSANEQCKLIFGPNASLLAIETEAEWQFLSIMLENYGFATTYWTSGIYDLESSLWIWAVNNQSLPSFVPDFPSDRNQLLRVVFYQTNRFDTDFRTALSIQLHRFICEVERVPIANPCSKTNDLAVILDVSENIRPANFAKFVDFVDKLAAAFTHHNESRLTFIVSSTTRIALTNTFNTSEISFLIQNTPFTGHYTAINQGIELAISQFNSSPRKITRSMVVLTDGFSNNKNLIEVAANRAIALGIQTFSVCATSNFNEQELLAITGNDPNRVFYSDNLENLIQMLEPLSLIMCTATL